MSSILTNNGAMIALQTLKAINANLGKTQDEISTGKSVSSAKDNAAVWAISKVMEAEVSGFQAISSGLSLGAAAVATARDGAEAITGLLTQMRDKIVTAQGATADKAKLQKDVTALADQIGTVIKGAQFNGLNLLDGSTATLAVLSSLDRSATGVSASNISVDAQNMSLGNYVTNTAFGTNTTGVSNAQDTAGFFLDGAGGEGVIEIDSGTTFAAGDSVSVRIGNKTASYTFTDSDIAATSPSALGAVGMKLAIERLGIAGLTVDYDEGSPTEIKLVNDGTDDLNVTAQFKNAGSGALGRLSTIDVENDAAGALADIEGMLQASITAAASFGSAGKRLEIQSGFLSKLTDSLKSGIGAMIDADMEAASARLQALQTQQQLGIQSLSIANQAPQAILSLFRG